MEDNINNVNEGAIKTAADMGASFLVPGYAQAKRVKHTVSGAVKGHLAKKEKKSKPMNNNSKTKFDEAYERTMSRFITPVTEDEHKEKGFLGKLGSAAKTAAGLGAAALAGGAIASPEFRSKLVGGAKGLVKGAGLGYKQGGVVGATDAAQGAADAASKAYGAGVDAGTLKGAEQAIKMQPGRGAPKGTRVALGDDGFVSQTPAMQKRDPVANYGRGKY